jgi:tetratricopeptide (TPR) repeat protein
MYAYAVDWRQCVSDSELRHLPYFEELARTDESDPLWHSVSAGLVVLRLVDSWIAGRPTKGIESWVIRAVREAISAIAHQTPTRRMLSAIVDVIVSSPSVDLHALSPRLMAYGETLVYEAKWPLAADVFETITAYAHPVEDADLAVSAYIQMAFSLRTLGNVDAAATAYSHASRIASAAGDLNGVLRGRLGDAKIAMARGNFPEADAILEEAVERAAFHGFRELQARALGDRSFLAGESKQYDRAICFSYAALAVAEHPRDRDRILNNIATGFRHLGLLDVARDAYLVIAATAQEQYVRCLAEINLMELAAEQRAEIHFDKYRRDLERAELSPVLRVTYLLHVGRGYHMLGNPDAGVPFLESALSMAESHKLNQMSFEAEDALTLARRGGRARRTGPPLGIDGRVQNVAEAIHELKTLASV